jgi:catechol 2,3-dioxygenase-like lactoylglutathione lyase family enzyme
VIQALDHVGIRCRRLERSLAFYNDLLAIPIREQGALHNGSTATITGRAGLDARYADLDLGGGRTLELIEMPSPDAETDGWPSAVHLALEVTDARVLHARLDAAGVAVGSEPVRVREPGFWQGALAFYARDPDGVTVELIELPGADGESGG